MRAAADAHVDRSSSGVNLMLICLHSSVAEKDDDEGAHTGEHIDGALLAALRRVLNE